MTKVEKKCEQCGTTFLYYHCPDKRRRFCSEVCHQQSRVVRSKRMLALCEECGSSLVCHPSDRKTGRGRYCSRRCASKAVHNRAEMREAHRIRLRRTWQENAHMRLAVLARANSDANPFKGSQAEAIRRKGHATLLLRGYAMLNGGNGKPPTVPEVALIQFLGDTWCWQHTIRTLEKRGSGFPPCYKVDIAHVRLRIAIEVDGLTHMTKKVRVLDAKKEAKLADLGWVVVRVRNVDVIRDIKAVVQRIQSITLQREQEITSHRAC